jgi:predicted nuclease of predicted toxin-antitoxin system
MKILLDQGTPRSAAALLRESGLDAIHTSEVGLATAEDPEILAYGAANNFCIVTLDADFHAYLALSGAKWPSTIRIRLQGLNSRDFVAVLVKVLAQCEGDLSKGALVSVRENAIRIRKLPIQ